MMSINAESKTLEARHQIAFHALEDLVPEEHLLRKIDRYIDFSFIYDLVEDVYRLDNGRPSIDPVTLIKIPIIQYLFGIPSMRQTIQDIQVNVAYRWFLGLSFTDAVPHFSTFGKNYKRRFEGTDLAEQIFLRFSSSVLKQAWLILKIFSLMAPMLKLAPMVGSIQMRKSLSRQNG